MIVTKRDCRQVPFDKNKIKVAILKAMNQGSGIPKEKIAEDSIKLLMNQISEPNVEIEEIVEESTLCLVDY